MEDKELLTVAIGPNAEYYLKKWENPKLFSFNGFALLFGPFWMVYRKITPYPLIFYFFIAWKTWNDIIFFPIVLNTENIEILYNGVWVYIVILAFFWILGGFLGNSLYYWNIKRKIQKICEKYADRRAQLVQIKKKGGTSVIYLLIYIALPTVVSTIIAYIMVRISVLNHL